MLHRQLRSPHARHLQGQHRHETARLAEPMVVAGGFWSVVPLCTDPIRSRPLVLRPADLASNRWMGSGLGFNRWTWRGFFIWKSKGGDRNGDAVVGLKRVELEGGDAIGERTRSGSRGEMAGGRRGLVVVVDRDRPRGAGHL